MKSRVGIFSIAASLLLAGGCAGGNGRLEDLIQPPDGEPVPPPVLAATCEVGANRGGAHGGIWAGDKLSSYGEETRLLVAETGEFRWISAPGGDAQNYGQFFGTFQINDHSLTSNDAVWVWINGLAWVETAFASADVRAELDEQSNLSLSYESESNPNPPDALSFSACNAVYTRASSLASLAGTYVNSDRMLAIDNQGEIFFQDHSCVGSGSAELIDPDFNMYRMELTMSHCSGNGFYVTGVTFSGLAYLSDSGPGFTNDLLEYSLSSVSADRILFYTQYAQR